jgi:hypothetical protein
MKFKFMLHRYTAGNIVYAFAIITLFAACNQKKDVTTSDTSIASGAGLRPVAIYYYC